MGSSLFFSFRFELGYPFVQVLENSLELVGLGFENFQFLLGCKGRGERRVCIWNNRHAKA